MIRRLTNHNLKSTLIEYEWLKMKCDQRASTQLDKCPVRVKDGPIWVSYSLLSMLFCPICNPMNNECQGYTISCCKVEGRQERQGQTSPGKSPLPNKPRRTFLNFPRNWFSNSSTWLRVKICWNQLCRFTPLTSTSRVVPSQGARVILQNQGILVYLT